MLLNCKNDIDTINGLIESIIDFRDNTERIANILCMNFTVENKGRLLDYLNKCYEIGHDMYVTKALIEACAGTHTEYRPDEDEYAQYNIEYQPKSRVEYEQYYIKEQDLTIIFEYLLDEEGIRERIRVSGMYFGDYKDDAKESKHWLEVYKHSGADIDLRCDMHVKQVEGKYHNLNEVTDTALGEKLGDVITARADHIIDEVCSLECEATEEICNNIRYHADMIQHEIMTYDGLNNKENRHE